VKIKAEGVEILKPIRNLIAEVEMRIGGSPDPNNPTLPCTKKIDDKVNQCPCAKVEGAWYAILLKLASKCYNILLSASSATSVGR